MTARGEGGQLHLWCNVLSACNACGSSVLKALAATPTVTVYSSVEGRVIGRTIEFEVRGGVDLWAALEIDARKPFARAAAVLAQEPNGIVRIVSVLATNLPREAIRRLAYVNPTN